MGSFSGLSPFGGIGGPERTVILFVAGDLSSFTVDPSGQLDIFWHDGDSLCVYGT